MRTNKISNEIEKWTKYYKQEIEADLRLGKININKDGYIKKSFCYKTDIHTGKIIRICGEGKTVETCARKLAMHRLRVDKKIDDIVNKVHTFKEVAESWFELNKAHANISDGNKSNYRGDLKNHIIPYFGNRDISQITEEDYQEFLNEFEGEGESMVKKIRMTLLNIIKYATKKRYRENLSVDLVMPETIPTKEKIPLDDNQIKLLISSQKVYQPAYVFVAMEGTGMRPCELYHIKYDAIDFENKTMFIGKSKTKNGIRTVPLPDYVVKLIIEDRNIQLAKGINPEYVFHQVKNPLLPHTSNSLRRNWKTTLRHMDILSGATVHRSKIIESKLKNKDKLVPYCLRHTYCTKLNDCGIGEYFKKRLMGHTLKDSITDSVYTHSSVERVMESAKPFLEEFERLVKESE